MASRWFSFVLWAAVAASALFWGLRWWVRPLSAPPHTQTAVEATTAEPSVDLARLFGADAVQPAAAPVESSSRFRLVGLAATARTDDASGWALISTDGRPARLLRLGDVVEGDWVVRAIHATGVAIGPRDGPPAVQLAATVLPPPATGTLMPPGTPGAPVGGPPLPGQHGPVTATVLGPNGVPLPPHSPAMPPLGPIGVSPQPAPQQVPAIPGQDPVAPTPNGVGPIGVPGADGGVVLPGQAGPGQTPGS